MSVKKQALVLCDRMLRLVEIFFHKNRNKLIYVHVLMCVFFIVITLVPLFLPEPPEHATVFEHFTQLSNFLFWTLWFPLVFLSVIFTGRSWCGLLCPMGAASEWINKKGLGWQIPAWMRWEGTPVISFLLVTVWGQTVGVRDHPEAIAIVFGSTLLAALLVGFLFGKKKRVWCRHVCPIGLLLGVFSRIGMLDFVPKSKKISQHRYTEKGLCPTMIKIASKDESRHCIECFRCVHPCSQGGLKLAWRVPGQEIERIHLHNPNTVEVWFLFLTTGAVLGGFLWLTHPSYQMLRQVVGQWFLERDWYWIFESGPMYLMSVYPERREVFNWLDFFCISGYMSLCTIFFAAILAFCTMISVLLTQRYHSTHQCKYKRFIALGYQYMPVAMVSIVIGLGSELLNSMALLGISEWAIDVIKTVLFICAVLWSVRIGYKVLFSQGTQGQQCILPLLVGAFGSLAIGYSWHIAISS